MAEDLQAIMSLMNDKFDESFAEDEPSKQRRFQNPPDLQPQQEKPKQSELEHSIEQVNAQDQQIVFRQHSLVIKTDNNEGFDAQNLKRQVSTLPKCQFQLPAPVQKEIQQMPTAQNNAQNEDEEEEQEQQSEKDTKPLILQMQTDENDDLLSYQSLTQKFDAAFSKLKHNQSVNSLAESQFTQRQQQYRRKKAKDINLLRAQKQKQLARLCTAKPLINSRSQQLLFNHKPIHIRYEAVIEEKKKKIETQVAQKVAKQTLEEEMQLNQIKKHQQQIKRKLGNEIRSQQAYYNEMRNWAQNKKKKIEDLAQKKSEQSQKEITFKPEISEKSQLIMKKYAVRVPIYEKKPVPKNATVDNNCTFKPNLNKTLKK